MHALKSFALLSSALVAVAPAAPAAAANLVSLEILAYTGMATPDGGTFTQLRAPSAAAGGHVAFTANALPDGAAASENGVYSWQGGALGKVAGIGDAVPNTLERVYQGFSLVDVDSAGSTFFSAGLTPVVGQPGTTGFVKYEGGVGSVMLLNGGPSELGDGSTVNLSRFDVTTTGEPTPSAAGGGAVAVIIPLVDTVTAPSNEHLFRIGDGAPTILVAEDADATIGTGPDEAAVTVNTLTQFAAANETGGVAFAADLNGIPNDQPSDDALVRVINGQIEMVALGFEMADGFADRFYDRFLEVAINDAGVVAFEARNESEIDQSASSAIFVAGLAGGPNRVLHRGQVLDDFVVSNIQNFALLGGEAVVADAVSSGDQALVYADAQGAEILLREGDTLTVNAMAVEIRSFTLLDPYLNGGTADNAFAALVNYDDALGNFGSAIIYAQVEGAAGAAVPLPGSGAALLAGLGAAAALRRRANG